MNKIQYRFFAEQKICKNHGLICSCLRLNPHPAHDRRKNKKQKKKMCPEWFFNARMELSNGLNSMCVAQSSPTVALRRQQQPDDRKPFVDLSMTHTHTHTLIQTRTGINIHIYNILSIIQRTHTSRKPRTISTCLTFRTKRLK